MIRKNNRRRKVQCSFKFLCFSCNHTWLQRLPNGPIHTSQCPKCARFVQSSQRVSGAIDLYETCLSIESLFGLILDTGGIFFLTLLAMHAKQDETKPWSNTSKNSTFFAISPPCQMFCFNKKKVFENRSNPTIDSRQYSEFICCEMHRSLCKSESVRLTFCSQGWKVNGFCGCFYSATSSFF